LQFICKYGTEDGKVEKKVITADTREAALNAIQKENLLVYEVRRARTLPFIDRLKKRRIKREEFLVFIREIIALLNAGLPLLQSLDILIRRRKEGHFLDVLTDVREQVKSGSSLAEAFKDHRDFSAMFISLVDSGEKSGELPAVLEQYLKYAEKFDELRRKLLSSLIYPAILVVLAIVLIFIMLTYVIPKFTAFYEGAERSLPAITQLLINVSEFVTSNILIILSLIFISIISFLYWKDTPAGRLFIDKTKLRLPIVGSVWHKYSLNQFSRSLAVMLSAGIPLLSALQVTLRTITNRAISIKLSNVIDEVNEGEPLYESLENTGVFPEIAAEMIQVGEQTGSLEELLTELAGYYDRDIDLTIDRVLRLLEPIFLIAMGIIIAGMLLAMYLPIFRAGALIQ
jgi:type IV pilus assembly protein PilC